MQLLQTNVDIVVVDEDWDSGNATATIIAGAESSWPTVVRIHGRVEYLTDGRDVARRFVAQVAEAREARA